MTSFICDDWWLYVPQRAGVSTEPLSNKAEFGILGRISQTVWRKPEVTDLNRHLYNALTIEYMHWENGSVYSVLKPDLNFATGSHV